VTLQLASGDLEAQMRFLPVQWAAQFGVNQSEVFVVLIAVNATTNLTIFRQASGATSLSSAEYRNLRQALAAALPRAMSGVSNSSSLFGNVSQIASPRLRRRLLETQHCPAGQTCLALPLFLIGLGSNAAQIEAATGALVMRRNTAMMATAVGAQGTDVSPPLLTVQLSLTYACSALNLSVCYDPCALLPACSATHIMAAPMPTAPQADALRKARFSSPALVAVVVLCVVISICFCVCVCLAAHRWYRRRVEGKGDKKVEAGASLWPAILMPSEPGTSAEVGALGGADATTPTRGDNVRALLHAESDDEPILCQLEL